MKYSITIPYSLRMLLLSHQSVITLVGLLALSIASTLYAEESSVTAEDEMNNGFALWKAIQPRSTHSEQTNQQQRNEQFQAIKKQINNLTSMPLTDQSTLYLRHNGFKIETHYKQGITTKFKADNEGDISYTVEFPF